MTDEPLTFSQPQNPWARISEIAAKVGVPPCEHGHPATITAEGADGNFYDVWAVIAAVLDKMDGVLTPHKDAEE